ncbi:MAG: NAD(P)H-dependent glycerol-3-phosphate dehydrogenase, partial [Acidobacteriota bacterium]|nr:NAD(P)H-dependent glycerol-3-phosphate dehydrogenase [Acidobacteriota bacterium]
KGVEHDSLKLPAEVCAAEMGAARGIAVLAGPSFARELAAGKPTAVAIASADAELSRDLQLSLASRSLRLYTNGDPVGVQLAGALKNVIAIAVGVTQGLDMGANAAAGLIARGLGEISRLGVALGGRVETFQGLAGIGDLVLTCYGEESRNRRYGYLLGSGVPREEIDARLSGIAEGVATSKAARTLAQEHDVVAPIIDETCRVLFEDVRPQDAVKRLLSRPLISEDIVERGRTK